jgi:hypothetical protein
MREERKGEMKKMVISSILLIAVPALIALGICVLVPTDVSKICDAMKGAYIIGGGLYFVLNEQRNWIADAFQVLVIVALMWQLIGYVQTVILPLYPGLFCCSL